MPKPENPRNNPFKQHNKEHLLTDPVFLIGNGKSRKTFDLEKLRSKGTIIGCNALYRDFTPDILVAIDAKMLNEINNSKFGNKENELLICPSNRQVAVKNSLKWTAKKFNTSGCFAMMLIASIMKPKICYMLGMDGFPGNVYDKTKNYSPNTLKNFTGVLRYYLEVLQSDHDTLFINVNEKDAWPEEAGKTGKYKFITYDDFELEVFEK